MSTHADFNITVRMRRDLKTKMGKCFHKGQVIKVKHSPAEPEIGAGEGWSAIHPIFESGRNPNVTVFIPLAWAARV